MLNLNRSDQSQPKSMDTITMAQKSPKDPVFTRLEQNTQLLIDDYLRIKQENQQLQQKINALEYKIGIILPVHQ